MCNDRNALPPVTGQQQIQRAQDSSAHLREIFSIWKSTLNWTRHPGVKNVRVTIFNFFVPEALEISEIYFGQSLHDLKRQPVRFNDNSHSLDCAAQRTPIEM